MEGPLGILDVEKTLGTRVRSSNEDYFIGKIETVATRTRKNNKENVTFADSRRCGTQTALPINESLS